MNETRLGASSKWPRMNEGGLGVEWMNDGKDEGRKHWWSVSGLLGLLCLAGARRPAGWRAHRTSTKDDGWVVIATRCDGCVVGWAVDTDLYTRAAISYPDVFRFSSQAGFGQTFAASLSALLNPLLNLGHRGIASGTNFSVCWQQIATDLIARECEFRKFLAAAVSVVLKVEPWECWVWDILYPKMVVA